MEDQFDSQGRAHILIVEDDEQMSSMIGEMLSPRYTTDAVPTVREAIEHSFHQLPDLILCDIKLPDGSGLKVIEKLKQDELTAHIPILIISSCTSEDDILKGLQMGADDYISKPFSNNELQLRILTQLENRKRIINWCRQQFKASNADTYSNLPSKEEQFLYKLRNSANDLLRTSQLSVDSLASKMAHSKRHLQRKVKEHMDCSCSDYIYVLRMAYAKDLSDKGYSIREIASLVGYKDVAHFNQIFRKYMEDKATGDADN